MSQPPRETIPSLSVPWRSWRLVPVALALFILSIILGLVMKSFGPRSSDLSWDVGLSHERSGPVNALALGIDYLFSPPGAVTLLLLTCLVLMFGLKRPLAALALGSIISVGWLAAVAGKVAVARLRPPGDLTHALITETGYASFPSGHTAFAVSIAWAVILVLARTRRQRIVTGLIGLLFAATVGASRLYLGVHYPSDVFGSLLISTSGILLWLPVWNRIVEPWLRRRLRFYTRTATQQ